MYTKSCLNDLIHLRNNIFKSKNYKEDFNELNIILA